MENQDTTEMGSWVHAWRPLSTILTASTSSARTAADAGHLPGMIFTSEGAIIVCLTIIFTAMP